MTLIKSLHRSHFISVTVDFPNWTIFVFSLDSLAQKVPDPGYNTDHTKENNVEEKSSCCERRKMSFVFYADSSILQTYQLGECHRQEVGASFQVRFLYD
jgi:hypothetical protein